MPQPLLDDALWKRIEPLLPKRRARNRQYAGRAPIPDRAVLTGILFVLRSGIPWRMLPREMGCGSGITCWRRLVRWQRAGVWKRLHVALLTELRQRGRLDLARAIVDSASLRAMPRGKKTGPNPTDRRKAGSKHHVLTDADGIPLVATLTAANRPDITELLDLVDAMPPIGGRPGPPCRKPDVVQGDRGYDSERHRDQLRQRGITPLIAYRYRGHGSGLGRTRWVVERTFAWLHRFRRLAVRYERRPSIHEAFLTLGCALICWYYLRPVH
ncbi:MAG: IS5 family transposase [Acidobacteriia bacterium]|nr:IS5 family transposase [Terriglobia bacterium]